MIVKNLIKLLENLNQDTEVLMAIDEEGNGFGRIANDYGVYIYKDKDVFVLFPSSHIDGLEINTREDEEENERPTQEQTDK